LRKVSICPYPLAADAVLAGWRRRWGEIVIPYAGENPMPYLKIQINCELAAEKSKALLSEASRTMAKELGKPERYVMVELTANPAMLFGGSDEPAAYVELKSIGLPIGQTKALSQTLAALLEASAGITSARVYIEFTDVQGKLWGWNGSTF
jgi:phenylpyruvate tautomerase